MQFGRFQNRVRVSDTLTMCREDFPYSANKSDVPRSQEWTDKMRVAVLIKLERSFSSLVEELTCKRESSQITRRSSEVDEALVT